MIFDIERAYNEYVPAVSAAVYACSLSTAKLLWQLCEQRKPERVLDIGSGFSSIILRTWAEEHDAEHWYIDTSAEWLQTTRAALDARGLDCLHGALWNSPALDGQEPFDLVFFDASEIATRSWYLRAALDMVADGGLFVADDAHDRHYRDALIEHASYHRRKCTYRDAEMECDEWGRFSGLIEVSGEPNPQPAGARPILFAPKPYEAEAVDGLLAIAQRGFDWVLLPRQRIDQTRDLAAWYLLDHPRYTHIVMLDGDHVHPRDIPDRLLRPMVEDPKKLVVAGYNYRRGPPFDPMAWTETPDGGLETLLNPEAVLVQVRQVASCAIAIAREVFERIYPSWFGYDYRNAYKRRYPTDDFAFCDRCAEAGIDVWCATEATSPHLYTTHVDRDFFEAYVKAHSDRIDPQGRFTEPVEGE